MANTPSREVRNVASTEGPLTAGSMARPLRRGQLVVGDPVAGEHDGVAFDPAAVGQHDALDSSSPDDLGDVDAGEHGTRWRVAVASLSTPYDWWRGSGVTIATALQPTWRRVRIAEKLTCSAPTITARVPTRVPAIASCCSEPVVKIRGRSPGTSRAAADRSRTPVARTIGIARIDVVEREHRRAAPHVDARSPWPASTKRACVARARYDAVQIADPEAEVIGVARDPAGLLLALVDGDVPDAEAAQLDRRGQPRRTAADDCHPAIGGRHGATLHPVSVHSSARQ